MSFSSVTGAAGASSVSAMVHNDNRNILAVADAAARPVPESGDGTAPVELPAVARPEDRANYEKGRRLLAAGDPKRALEPLTEAARGL